MKLLAFRSFSYLFICLSLPLICFCTFCSLTSFVRRPHQRTTGCVGKSQFISYFLPVFELLRGDVLSHLWYNKQQQKQSSSSAQLSWTRSCASLTLPRTLRCNLVGRMYWPRVIQSTSASLKSAIKRKSTSHWTIPERVLVLRLSSTVFSCLVGTRKI